MTDILSHPSQNSYSFASARYFCSSCNRQFSQIKVDPTASAARCPRCNLYADEVPVQNQPRPQAQQRTPNIGNRVPPPNRNNSGQNVSYVYVRDAFGRLYLQPVYTNSTHNARNSQQSTQYMNPFDTFFGGSSSSSAYNFSPFGFFTAFPTGQENSEQQVGAPPASQEAINRLETVEYKAENVEGEEGKSCSICYEEYKQGEKLVKLPCKHDYHGECVRPWLNKHNSCPMCRKEI